MIPPPPPFYVAAVESMVRNGKAWLAANPHKAPKIQFNFPPKVCLVAPIGLAYAMHLVTADEAGLELLQALAPWGGPEEPTVIMVRAVLEAGLESP